MTRLRSLGSGVWAFVVGEDPLLALGVVVTIALTALVASTDIASWWVMPFGVAVVLTGSLRRAGRAGGGD